MKSIDFKRFMFEQKIKQSELAQYLKVSEGYISQVANGKKQLSDENFSKVLNNSFGWDVSMLTENQPEIPAEEKPMVSNSLLEYLQRKVEQLERENAELLQENAVLRYENTMLSPRKGDAEDVGNSLSASAV
jgi:transcriptional regulator with XRE-family HTH domain